MSMNCASTVRVTAVVVNYVNYQETAECVTTLLRQSCVGLNCVVVDNASPNESTNQLRAAFEANERVVVVDAGENGGYAKGNNVGVRYAVQRFRPQYLLIINPDIALADRTTIEHLVSFAETTVDAAAVGPKVVLPGGFVQGPYRRPSLIRTCFYYVFPIAWYIVRKRHQKWVSRLNQPARCFRTIGACMLVRTEDFLRVGMFDQSTFLEWEEPILAERFRRLGKYFYYDPRVTVVHNHSRLGDLRRGLEASKYYFQHYRGANNGSLVLLQVCASLYRRLYVPLRHRLGGFLSL